MPDESVIADSGPLIALVAAKRRSLVAEVRPIFEKMRQGGYFLADELIERTCDSVGERA